MKKINAFIISYMFFHLAGSAADLSPIDPMIRVIAAPQEYDGLEIKTVGVLGKNDLGIIVLYIDEGSKRNEVYINALAVFAEGSVRKDAEKFLGKYVIVFGTFKNNSYRNEYSGVIDKVTLILDYPIIKDIEQ